MIWKELDIKGVYEIRLIPNNDERGHFLRTYDENIFRRHSKNHQWVQESQSFSKLKNTIRGFHCQLPPFSESKLIRIVNGAVHNVYLDLRKESPTFGKYGGIDLIATNFNMLYTPKGIANCILTTSDDVILLYKSDNLYNPPSSLSIKWDDPDLNIKWPIDGNPIISNKDKNAMTFKEFKEKYRGI